MYWWFWRWVGRLDWQYKKTLAVAVIEQKHKIRLPQAFCEVLGISATVSANITAMIHTAMSIDRWVSVRFPNNNVSLLEGWNEVSLNNHHNYHRISFVYPVRVTYILLRYELIGFYFDIDIPFCVIETGRNGIFGLLVSISLFLILPLILQAFTNIDMLIIVNKLRGKNRTRMRNSIKTVVTTLGVLYLCWFPVLIWLLWEVATTSIPNSGFTYFAIRMILSNSGMSFPIYLKTLPQFKEGFLSIISIHGAQAPAAFSRRMQVSPAKQPPVSWWWVKKTNLDAAV